MRGQLMPWPRCPRSICSVDGDRDAQTRSANLPPGSRRLCEAPLKQGFKGLILPMQAESRFSPITAAYHCIYCGYDAAAAAVVAC